MFKLSRYTFTYTRSTFKAKDLDITLKAQTSPICIDQYTYQFGRVPTDHMITIDHDESKGWSIPRLTPFRHISVHPFNATLHYALSCFEGMKAFKDKNGTPLLFRPDLNMQRFLRSCERLALPSFDPDELLELIKKFISIEKNWIPTRLDSSLYIRPFAMSMGANLGVEKSTKSSILLTACPVTSYFKDDEEIKLKVDETYERGTPHNAAQFKMSSNYAPTISITDKAMREGFMQTIWTYQGNLLESGASNLFIVLESDTGKKTLLTHPLDGSILPGVTRDSILKLTKTNYPDVDVQERPFSITEFFENYKKGNLAEVFMSGTAAVVSPVDKIEIRGQMYSLDDKKKILARQLKKDIEDIQRGNVVHEFSVRADQLYFQLYNIFQFLQLINLIKFFIFQWWKSI